MIRSNDARRRGATAVVAALSLLPIIGVTALIIDGGRLMAERRRAQAAADAASFAAVCTYDKVSKAGNGRDPWTAAQAAARTYAAANGYNNDGVNSSVAVVQTSVVKNLRYKSKNPDLVIQATITAPQTQLFSTVFRSSPTSVVARSTSLRISGSADPSLIVLNSKDQGSLSVAGSARIIAEGEVQVKSNHAKAVDLNNMGHVKAPTTRIVGGYQLSSSGYFDNGTSSVKTGSDATAMKDPLADTLPHPDPAGMTTRTSPSGWNATNPFPIYPGVYNSGLTLNSGGMNYTMSPGIYYIKSGNFVVSNGVRVTGTGVMVYLYDGNVDVQGGEGISLTSPTSGTYQGVGIFQRSVYDAGTGTYAPHTISVANGTNNKITDGRIYAPGATMTVAGGSNNTYGKQLIVNKLNISNNAVINLPQMVGGSTAKFYLSD